MFNNAIFLFFVLKGVTNGRISCFVTSGDAVFINCFRSRLIDRGSCKCSSSYVGIDCSHPKSTPPSNLSLPDSGLCKNTKRPCEETNIFGYFQSDTLYVKFKEFEVTILGSTTTLSTIILQPKYISLTLLKINIPKTRSKRSSSVDAYGRGFYISLSYDAIHFSDYLTIVIYNDACYSCSATPPECNITSTCQKTSTKVSTVTPSSTLDVKTDDFSGGSNLVSLMKKDEVAWIITTCVLSVIILCLLAAFVVYQIKPKLTKCLSNESPNSEMEIRLLEHNNCEPEDLAT